MITDTGRLKTALADRYVIERELGAGGMATVYLARDVKHEREVALKVLRPELGAVLGADRFLAEIKITARLDHPHILTLIDSGAAEGFLYYVLPYVRGESLRVKLEREKQLGVEEALSITKQIASALDYAHQHGVVHRDIKPENILLHEGEAVLADFGIALAVKEAGGNRLTETGLSLGTPQYMSPEQATGDRMLDARSDVYSLAAVLYEMLAGEPPVTGATAQAMIAKLMTERPTRIRIVRDTVPEGIDNAVAKALAKVPADRFARAGEFAQALSAGSRDSGGARVRGGRPGIAAAIGGGAVLLAAIIWAITQQGGRAAAPRVQLDRVQLTFTGNARYPSLSPDGQRVAYAIRQCDAAGRCTQDIVIQDVAGAGAATVVRGLSALWDIEWTADGRYLLFDGSYGASRWGAFAIPTLGGTAPRFLGCCGGNLVVGGDTAVITAPLNDTTVVARFSTIADGIVHDSLMLSRPGPASEGYVGARLPGRLIVQLNSSAGMSVRLLERGGRLLDTLWFPGPLVPFFNAAPDGSLVFFFPRADRDREYDVVRHAVDERGRISPRGDTIARQLAMDAGLRIAANGQVTLAAGPAEFALWTLTRSGPGSVRFTTQRRNASGTAFLSGSVAPAGDRIALFRTVSSGARELRQVSVMPFDSGPETPLGTPLADLFDWDWREDGTALRVATRRPDGSVALQELDATTGRLTPLRSFAATEYGEVESLEGGGYTVIAPDGRTLRVFRPGGDTAFTLPTAAGFPRHTEGSPDGRFLATLGWDLLFDSIVVQRIDLGTGAVTRLAAFSGEGSDGVRWLPDGTLEFGFLETEGSLAWYRMPASGGRPVRVGAPPRQPASYRTSADGRRVLARVNDRKADVYLIRNFAELLRSP